MKKSRILSTAISVAMLASCFTAVSPASAAPFDNSSVNAEGTAASGAELMAAEPTVYDFTAMSAAPVYSAEAGSGFAGKTSSVGSMTTTAGKADTTAGTARTVAAPETITMNGGALTDNASGMVFRADVAPGAYKISVTGIDGTTKDNTAVSVSGMEASRIVGTGAWDTAGLVNRTAPAKWTDNVWSYDFVTGENFIEIEIEGIGGAAVGVKNITITPIATKQAGDKPTVFVLGDSTQKTYTFEENSMSGYGQVLYQMFDLSKVNVINYSMGGRSMRTNYQEGRFNDVLINAKPGDYVFIHSAHNDETSDEGSRFGRGTSAGMYKNFLENVYIPAIKAVGAVPVLVTSMPRTSDGLYKESTEKPNGFNPDSPGMMRAAAESNPDVKLIELYDGAKKYIDEIGADETVYIYQSLEAGESAGKTNSGSYANGHPDNKIDGTHYKEAYAKQLARIIAQDIYAKKSDDKLGILADALKAGVKEACEDGDWTKNVFPEMAKDVSTVGGASQGTNAYYRNQIEKMLQLGVMAKDAEGNFNPEAQMTVGGFAKSMTELWNLDSAVLSDYMGEVTTAPTTAVTTAPTAPVTEETTAPTEKPPFSETAALKFVAKYDANGRLLSASVEDIMYNSESIIAPVDGAKVFVWNKADMQPLCTPITSSVASLSAAGDTLTWVCSAADSGCAAGHELFPGLTTLFADNKNNGKYIQAKDNCDWNDSTGSATSGAGLKFVAPEDGVITLTLSSLGSGKSAHIIEEGKTLAEAIANIDGPNTVLSGFVTGGKTYYLIGKGTKPGMSEAKFVPGAPATPSPKPTVDPNKTPEPELVERTPIDASAALTREAMAAILYDAYDAKFGKKADGSWNKPVYMTDYNGTALSPDDPNYDPNLTGESSQYYPLVGWGAITDADSIDGSLYAKVKEVYNLGLMRSEKGIARGKMINGTEIEPKTVVTRAKAAKELFFLYGLIQDKKAENHIIPGENMAAVKVEPLVTPDPSKPSVPGGGSVAPKPTPTTAPTTKPGELPADESWTVNDAAVNTAVTSTADGVMFEAVNGLSGYGQWKNYNSSAVYTHTNGVEYTFNQSWRAGSGNATRRSFQFTPKQACIVTVAYTSQAGRPIYITQGGTTLASGEDSAVGGVAATLVADIEDISKGDVVIYGGSSNKDIFGIFADYYDPNVVVNRKVSGNISYAGSKTGLNVVFTDTKDGNTYKVPAVNGAYETELRQNRKYDITVQNADGTISDEVAVTMDTNNISLAKMDKTHNINLVDIAEMDVSGDVVVHEVTNDASSLDLSKVELTFTAKDDASIVYKTNVTDNKINVKMIPNHEYEVTASGIDGYTLSPLSGSYVMAAGDMSPFKNILITENVQDISFSATVEVGKDKAYTRINDAITAIKAMKDRPAGEAGRVTVAIDPGTYVEQVIVDTDYVTLKAADPENRPTVSWYYGIGYIYYSSAGNQYYSEDYAVAKTKKGPVTRWGAACRITKQYVNVESIIFKNSFSCEVTAEEMADGCAPALNNEYSDVNGKPDRSVEGYDAKTKNAVERAAAIALDGAYTELYKCDFISSQDTFYTNNTAYVKECYIEGATDFIYGGNSILFEDCTLAWHGYSDQATGGYLTACKTAGAPTVGVANTGTNGYMFKNTTVVNSKYFPDNQFAPGSWGRNWGGAACQVVFDGVKLETATPGAWVKMGGELNTSVLYVNNVTDKDGNVLDVSGTAFNPNGTMAANNYEMIKDIDYFGGTWVPPHYDKEIVLDEYTSVWYFGNSNGAPDYNMQGDGAEIDITASSSNNPTEQVMHVNATSGKFNNAGRGDEWAQWTTGTVLTVPVVNGSVITLATYQSGGTATINGEAVSNDKPYTYYGTESTVDIISTNGGYISSVTVVSPVNPSTDIPTPPPVQDIAGTITGLDAADVSTVKLVGKVNGAYTLLDVTDGAFSLQLKDGESMSSIAVLNGNYAYTVPADTAISNENAAPEIAVTKVEAAAEAGTRAYNLGNGSIVPQSTVMGFDRIVAPDGLLTLKDVKFHDSQHGVQQNSQNLVIEIPVAAGESTITFGGCAYASAVITAPEEVSPASADLKTATDGAAIEFTYGGEAATLVFTIGNGSIYLHNVAVTTVAADATPIPTIDPNAPVDYAVDFTNEETNHKYFTADETVQWGAIPDFGLTVDNERVAADAPNAAMVFSGYKFHSSVHGVVPGTLTVKVPGPVEIAVGNNQFGNNVTVKDGAGNTVGTVNISNVGNTYDSSNPDRVSIIRYNAAEPTTLTISGGGYVGFYSIKTCEPKSEATVTFAMGTDQAEGTLPSEIKQEIGSEVTLPVNRTLYAEGKTLTAWSDGISAYAPGSTVTLAEDMSLTPVFTDNTAVPSGTVVFDFQQKNGAPVISMQGKTGILVEQAAVNGVNIDVKMDIDTTSGKLANGNWIDWAQVNGGTKFIVPVTAGAVVTVGDLFGDDGEYTINGVAKVGDNGSETAVADGTMEIVAGEKSGSYWRTISVEYPTV